MLSRKELLLRKKGLLLKRKAFLESRVGSPDVQSMKEQPGLFSDVAAGAKPVIEGAADYFNMLPTVQSNLEAMKQSFQAGDFDSFTQVRDDTKAKLMKEVETRKDGDPLKYLSGQILAELGVEAAAVAALMATGVGAVPALAYVGLGGGLARGYFGAEEGEEMSEAGWSGVAGSIGGMAGPILKQAGEVASVVGPKIMNSPVVKWSKGAIDGLTKSIIGTTMDDAAVAAKLGAKGIALEGRSAVKYVRGKLSQARKYLEEGIGVVDKKIDNVIDMVVGEVDALSGSGIKSSHMLDLIDDYSKGPGADSMIKELALDSNKYLSEMDYMKQQILGRSGAKALKKSQAEIAQIQKNIKAEKLGLELSFKQQGKWSLDKEAQMTLGEFHDEMMRLDTIAENQTRKAIDKNIRPFSNREILKFKRDVQKRLRMDKNKAKFAGGGSIDIAGPQAFKDPANEMMVSSLGRELDDILHENINDWLPVVAEQARQAGDPYWHIIPKTSWKDWMQESHRVKTLRDTIPTHEQFTAEMAEKGFSSAIDRVAAWREGSELIQAPQVSSLLKNFDVEYAPALRELDVLRTHGGLSEFGRIGKAVGALSSSAGELVPLGKHYGGKLGAGPVGPMARQIPSVVGGRMGIPAGIEELGQDFANYATEGLIPAAGAAEVEGWKIPRNANAIIEQADKIEPIANMVDPSGELSKTFKEAVRHRDEAQIEHMVSELSDMFGEHFESSPLRTSKGVVKDAVYTDDGEVKVPSPASREQLLNDTYNDHQKSYKERMEISDYLNTANKYKVEAVKVPTPIEAASAVQQQAEPFAKIAESLDTQARHGEQMSRLEKLEDIAKRKQKVVKKAPVKAPIKAPKAKPKVYKTDTALWSPEYKADVKEVKKAKKPQYIPPSKREELIKKTVYPNLGM